ncbi:hypothetical protein [Paraburkholderia tropica]|uniref:hypothetical protein n=1 Tax=Paraburkholderia tropica TaxID=92647 RepID=UPI002AB22719|nr:hypothetical protein [Paraburkholderia tropica]
MNMGVVSLGVAQPRPRRRACEKSEKSSGVRIARTARMGVRIYFAMRITVQARRKSHGRSNAFRRESTLNQRDITRMTERAKSKMQNAASFSGQAA